MPKVESSNLTSTVKDIVRHLRTLRLMVTGDRYGDTSGLDTEAKTLVQAVNEFLLSFEAHASRHALGGDDELKLNQLGLPVASVAFNDQQATSFRVENRTTDPVSPTVGQLWLRTDL